MIAGLIQSRTGYGYFAAPVKIIPQYIPRQTLEVYIVKDGMTNRNFVFTSIFLNNSFLARL